MGDKRLGSRDFLQSYITYDKKKYNFEYTSIEPLSVGGNGFAIRTKGEIHLPDEIRGGSFTYDYITTDFSDGIFVRTEVNYPYTAETTSISTENSALGRYSDMKWSEAVPFQLTPDFKGDTSVLKRNFMDDISSFRTQSFPECDEKNKKLDSFNHQLSAGLVGLFDENYTFAVANARQVSGSMAHCPMRLDEDKTVHMNPFGTYFGKQRNHWSRAKGQIIDTFTLITPQGKSIAPAYNGVSETSLLGLYAYKGEMPSDDILSFADGAVVAADENSILQPFYEDNVRFEKAKEDNIDEKKLRSPIMTGIGGNLRNYAVTGSRAIFHIIKQQIKAR